MANNDRKQSSKFFAPRWGCNKLRVYFSIVINLLRRCSTKKYQEPNLLKSISKTFFFFSKIKVFIEEKMLLNEKNSVQLVSEKNRNAEHTDFYRFTRIKTASIIQHLT